MIISFFGHSSLINTDYLYEKVEETIVNNINHNERILFYCGGYGDFDNLCAKICREIKSQHQNCELVFVTPYITKAQQIKMKRWMNEKLYDSIVYPPLENVPKRFAISRRNEWMINESDLIIAYVQHPFGGAYKALEYAKKKKKLTINLAIE
ncbi:MAG: hypothetical protein E7589_04170 [Ruminococcaceae bacterium]|nr:hypothetical protein [Oscillospiraceae bacterium]